MEYMECLDKDTKKKKDSQGCRKQFYSSQANQLQNYMYKECRVTSGHKCKLLCEAQSSCTTC